MISLKSKITQEILNIFLLNLESRFYVNELARTIKKDPSNVYKKLLELKKVGIISDEFSGKERFFFINRKFPLLKEYKNIILKTVGFEQNLKEKLKKIAGIKGVYIFGSYAKDKLSQESDIDVLVVGDAKMIEIQNIFTEMQRMAGREINSVEMSETEFKNKIKSKDPFLKDIFENKFIQII